MAADITDITDSNQPDIRSQLEHVVTDLHEVLKVLRDQGVIQARHDRLLREFEPLLAQFRSPAAAMFAGRKARKVSRLGELGAAVDRGRLPDALRGSYLDLDRPGVDGASPNKP